MIRSGTRRGALPVRFGEDAGAARQSCTHSLVWSRLDRARLEDLTVTCRIADAQLWPQRQPSYEILKERDWEALGGLSAPVVAQVAGGDAGCV